jgi:hypothetical protein
MTSPTPRHARWHRDLYDETVSPSDRGRRRDRSALGSLIAPISVIALTLVASALLCACGSGSSTHSSSGKPGGASIATATAAPSPTAAKPLPTPPLPPPTHTSCRSVIYVGESTSDGEAFAEFVPNQRLRAPAQLLRVGVKTTHMEVSGARSIHETFEGNPNAATVAQQQISAGFRGCWILALGTNEAADVAAGSRFGLRTRIAQMMSIIGDQPVMWVDAITLASATQFYGDAGMRRWNEDLLSACHKYPMMRVFDWAAHAKPSWFIPDGIHYTLDGYIARTRLIAHALVRAFPLGRPPSASCLVQ